MELPPGGTELPESAADQRWRAWTPGEVAERLAGVTVPWGVAAGWAIELFLGRPVRDHDDLEITTPVSAFPAVQAALAGYEWDVVGNGQCWPFPVATEVMHQTWLRDPGTGHYHLDVFREPHDGDTWICRREPRIRLPYDEVYGRTTSGLPYVVPEVALLFKAKALRDKDQVDFEATLPALDVARRERLRSWLGIAHPGHPWHDELG